MQFTRIDKWYGDARAAFSDDAARNRHRLGRLDDGVTDRQHPSGALAIEACEFRFIENEPEDGLTFRASLQRSRAKQLLVFECIGLDLRLTVEHKPHRAPAVEHRRRCCRSERKIDAKIAPL